MKITRRWKISFTRHRLVKSLFGFERVVCPACGCEIKSRAALSEARLFSLSPLIDEAVLPPQETRLSREESTYLTARVPVAFEKLEETDS
jgi:hypothetical protein